MIDQSVIRPRKGPAWFVRESTGTALGALSLGGIALLTIIVGGLIVLAERGYTPHEALAEGLQSTELQLVLAVGVGLGVLAAGAGWGTYRRMPTKLSREEAIAGAVLGMQAAALGGLLLWWVQGRIEIFARSLLDFERLGPAVGAFVRGAKNTLILAGAGEGIGIVLGLFLAVFLISKRPVVRAPARIFVNFLRGTPLLWQLSFFHFALVLGLRLGFDVYTTGIIVFGLNTAAYAAEVFRAGIQSVERAQLEAARGLGMSYFQAMRFAVIPQAVRRVIPPLTNEFVILIKDTSLIAFLGLTASQYELFSVGEARYGTTFNATFFVGTALGYLAITLPLIRLVNFVEGKLRSGLVGVSGA